MLIYNKSGAMRHNRENGANPLRTRRCDRGRTLPLTTAHRKPCGKVQLVD
jgi:hypothetical protein